MTMALEFQCTLLFLLFVFKTASLVASLIKNLTAMQGFHGA